MQVAKVIYLIHLREPQCQKDTLVYSNTAFPCEPYTQNIKYRLYDSLLIANKSRENINDNAMFFTVVIGFTKFVTYSGSLRKFETEKRHKSKIRVT